MYLNPIKHSFAQPITARPVITTLFVLTGGRLAASDAVCPSILRVAILSYSKK